jgi:hypothetical protein
VLFVELEQKQNIIMGHEREDSLGFRWDSIQYEQVIENVLKACDWERQGLETSKGREWQTKGEVRVSCI